MTNDLVLKVKNLNVVLDGEEMIRFHSQKYDQKSHPIFVWRITLRKPGLSIGDIWLQGDGSAGRSSDCYCWRLFLCNVFRP